MYKADIANIVEINTGELKKCKSFWFVPDDIESYRLTKLMKSGETRAFAYKLNDEFIGGCALTDINDECGHISFFAVKSDMRRKGIGSCIIDFASLHFKRMGKNKLRLHVDKGNANAIRLYSRKGFEYAYDASSDRIAMVKEL